MGRLLKKMSLQSRVRPMPWKKISAPMRIRTPNGAGDSHETETGVKNGQCPTLNFAVPINRRCPNGIPVIWLIF
jgi:hypothetical protein